MKGLAYLAAGIAIGLWLASFRAQAPAPAQSVIVRHDTILIHAPQPAEVRPAPRRAVAPIAKAETEAPDCAVVIGDTAVSIPIAQAYYSDSLFEAWVSGFSPALDSLRLRLPVVETRLAPRSRTRHWHLGATVGVGITPQGPRPYLGIGLTYSFASF